jgi:hypothetical protein
MQLPQDVRARNSHRQVGKVHIDTHRKAGATAGTPTTSRLLSEFGKIRTYAPSARYRRLAFYTYFKHR